MTQSKPLCLISPRLDAGEYRDKLIGSVIKYPERPTDKRVPYHSKRNPRDIVADLDPKPVQVHNVEFWKRRITDDGLKATVNDIFDGFIEHARSVDSSHVATVARIWHMDSPEEKFKELLKDKDYFDEVYDLLQQNGGSAYFVSDVVSLVNLESASSSHHSNGAGVEAKVPIDPSTGIKIGGGVKAQVSRGQGKFMVYDEEVILFLGYRMVHLDKVDGLRARFKSSLLGGSKRTHEVRYGADYWPTLKDGPAGGKHSYLDYDSQPTAFADEVVPEDEEIMNQLDFIPCLVGEHDV